MISFIMLAISFNADLLQKKEMATRELYMHVSSAGEASIQY